MPTRQQNDDYRILSQQVNELVGRINGTHGTLEYSPIHYINQSVSQQELFGSFWDGWDGWDGDDEQFVL